MATRLHQIVALQHGVEDETKAKVAQVQHLFGVGGDQDPLTGLSRTYEPKGSEGDEKPPEFRKVQVTAAELIAVATKALSRLLDLKLTREEGNCKARADVEVDGTVILEDVPVGYLLFLEGKLGELIKLIDAIPTLNPAESWDDTVPGLREGEWASAVRKREVKDRLPQVQELTKAQVIDGHAFQPQVRPYETEVVIGWFHTVKYSGQLDPKIAQQIRERAMLALQAVRFARERANTLEIPAEHAHPGADLLGYIFGDLVG